VLGQLGTNIRLPRGRLGGNFDVLHGAFHLSEMCAAAAPATCRFRRPNDLKPITRPGSGNPITNGWTLRARSDKHAEECASCVIEAARPPARLWARVRRPRGLFRG
jgi:hypothetical protein